MEVSMSLPKSEVVIALIDSYINFRKEKWGLVVTESNSIKLPEDATALYKIETCKKILKDAKNAKTIEDWIGICNDLFHKEIAEYELTQKFTTKYNPLSDAGKLYELLRALRSYCLSQLNAENHFKEIKSKLESDIEELEKNILYKRKHAETADKVKKVELGEAIKKHEDEMADKTKQLRALDSSKEYYHDYFLTIIKERDILAKVLKENSFEDFIASVVNHSRPSLLSLKLIETNEKKLEVEKVDGKKDLPPHAGTLPLPQFEAPAPLPVQNVDVLPERKPTRSATKYAEVVTNASTHTTENKSTATEDEKEKLKLSDKDEVSPHIRNSIFVPPVKTRTSTRKPRETGQSRHRDAEATQTYKPY